MPILTIARNEYEKYTRISVLLPILARTHMNKLFAGLILHPKWQFQEAFPRQQPSSESGKYWHSLSFSLNGRASCII
jgi:hypothetical protein